MRKIIIYRTIKIFNRKGSLNFQRICTNWRSEKGNSIKSSSELMMANLMQPQNQMNSQKRRLSFMLPLSSSISMGAFIFAGCGG